MGGGQKSQRQNDPQRDHAMIPLYILEILKERETSEERRLIHKEIEAALGDDYDIWMERKAVSRYVNYLIDAGYAGKLEGKHGCYYIPEQPWEEDELRQLLYSVAGNPALSRGDAEELMAGLAALAPNTLPAALAIEPSGDKSVKTRRVMDNLKLVEEALLRKKPIYFELLRYGCSKRLSKHENVVLYPKNVMLMQKHFVVTGYDEELCVDAAYPLDLMDAVKVLEWESGALMDAVRNVDSDVAKDRDYYWIYDLYIYPYIRRSPDRRKIKVRLKAHRMLLDEIIDVFGKDVQILHEGDDTANPHLDVMELWVEAQKDTLEKWIMSHALQTEVREPEDFRQRIADNLRRGLAHYESQADWKEDLTCRR